MTAKGTGSVAITNNTGIKLTGVTGGASPTSISVSPGGSNTQIQFNDSGALAGSASLTWDKSTKLLTR